MGLTRSEFSEFQFLTSSPLPPPHLVRVVVDMALETMTQTSKTKSVTISLLKHLIGGPLGTTTTLVDHWFMSSEASLPPIKTAFVSVTRRHNKANVTNFK